MQTLDSLNNLAKTTTEILSLAKNTNNFLSGLVARNIQMSTREIENRFKIDYSRRINISQDETNRLKQMILVFLKDKKDTFNTYYIQLLAWNINKVKIMKIKTKYGETLQSFLEYAPNPLIPFSVTNKIFSLFYEKVSTALLLNYLNNYKYTSTRFKNLLRRYLKSIKYSKDVDVYFSMVRIEQILAKHPVDMWNNNNKKIAEILGIRENTLNTEYFKFALKQSLEFSAMQIH